MRINGTQKLSETENALKKMTGSGNDNRKEKVSSTRAVKKLLEKYSNIRGSRT